MNQELLELEIVMLGLPCTEWPPKSLTDYQPICIDLSTTDSEVIINNNYIIIIKQCNA